jgi:hypothetical protein
MDGGSVIQRGSFVLKLVGVVALVLLITSTFFPNRPLTNEEMQALTSLELIIGSE